MTAKLLEDFRNWLWPMRPAAGHDMRPPAPDATEPASLCVFVIDDEEGVCKFISMTLATLGVAAESFDSADTALSSLDRRTPAIIFLDVALKKSDGIEVIRGLGERCYGGVVQVMSGSDISLLDDVCRVGVRYGLKMRP